MERDQGFHRAQRQCWETRLSKKGWGALGRKLTADCVTPSPANVTLRASRDCRKGRDIWLSLENESGNKAAFTPRGLVGQPLKPEQRRGFDTHFSFNNPCHWTSPGISLFQPPRDPGFLHPGCMCLFSAHLCAFVGQHSWQVPEDALHPAGLKLPALGVPALARALLEHPADRVLMMAAASRCSHQTKKKKPRGSARMQGSRCFSEESACAPALPCRAPGAAALASPWKSLRALEGSGGHGGEQPAVSIKGRTPLLVRVLPTASGLALRLSCYLCLSFACFSWGPPPALPGEPEHLPSAPQAGWKGGSVAGSSSISRTSRNVLPGEPPWLPPSFFIHENSISLGAGCQRQPLKRGVLRPPLPRAGPLPSGQQSCPGAAPDSGTRELATRSTCAHPTQAARAGTGRSGSPGHTPQSQSTPKTKSHTYSK